VLFSVDSLPTRADRFIWTVLRPLYFVAKATLGLVPEFVNPKYADSDRKQFKKPTRLECMMQDFPRYFDASKVGFTTITGTGFAEKQGQVDLDRPISFYSPVKNNVLDGAAKARKGQVPGCAAAGESDVYVFLFPVDYISCGRCRRSQSRSVDIIQMNHNKFMMFRRSHKFWSVPSIT
jgi:hypothetical protein